MRCQNWLFVGVIASVCCLGGLGCKKKSTTPTSAPPVTQPTGAPAASGDGEPSMFPGLAGGIVANPQAVGGGGGGGAIQAVRGAARRAASQNDLQQIRLIIEDAFNTNGKMPTAQETLTALQQSAPNIAALVKDQTITLNNARTRQDVWAYETAALSNGGLMLTSSGVERVDAATLRQRLGR